MKNNYSNILEEEENQILSPIQEDLEWNNMVDNMDKELFKMEYDCENCRKLFKIEKELHEHIKNIQSWCLKLII